MTSINTSNKPLPSDADVIKSFARNAEVRQNNYSMVDFATGCVLDGSSVVSKSTGASIDFKEIVNTFNQLCVNTNNVQIAIEHGQRLTPALLNAHRGLQTGLNSIAPRVLQAALKTGVIQPEKTEVTASRFPSAKKMIAGTLATGAIVAGYIHRETLADQIPQSIKDNMPEFTIPAFIQDNIPEMPAFIKDNMPEFKMPEVPSFIKDNMPEFTMPEFSVPSFIKDNIPEFTMPEFKMPEFTMPNLETITELFFSVDASTQAITMSYGQMGATAGAVAVIGTGIYAGVKYRKQIGSGIATVASTVANVAVAPFKMCASVFHRG